MYNIYLGGLLLPVAPSSIQTKTKNQNKVHILMNEGEVNILKDKGLDEISFTFLLPTNKYNFAKFLGGYLPLQYYIEQLKKMKEDKKPVTFIILRNLNKISQVYNTSTLVSIESYNPVEDAKEYGCDIGIAITLKEYKSKSNVVIDSLNTVSEVIGLGGIVTGTINGVIDIFKNGNEVKTSTQKMVREIYKKTEKTYTVKEGDTLPDICKKLLGDETVYGSIAILNNIENPLELISGSVIRLE